MRPLRVVLLSLTIILSAGATLGAADLKDVYDDAQRNFRRGQYEAAAAGWTRILSPDPSDTGTETIDLSRVYFNRGITYKKLQKWAEAADDFSMVVGFDPNDAEAYYQRGGCYRMLGLEDKADADVLRACELADDYCSEAMLRAKHKTDEIDWGGNR